MESVLNAHNQRLEDAVHSLRALCLRDVSGTNNTLSPDEVVKMSESAVQGHFMAFLIDLFFFPGKLWPFFTAYVYLITI